MELIMNSKEYYREYREKNKLKIRQYNKKYREENKEKCDLWKNNWLKKNPKKRKEVIEKYNNSKKISIEASIDCFLNKVLGRIKRKDKTCHKAARVKYQVCDLTLEYLMQMWMQQNGKCALTNKKMTHKFNSLFAVSVDRIDSSIGYMQGNIQLVCQSVNYAKNKFTNEQFIHFWNSKEDE